MSIAPRQGMVLAAGLGKRLRPLTDQMPKPMVPVAGRTLIDRALDRLEEAGVTKAVVNTSYKAEMLENHLTDRGHPQLVFSREESPLETGGGIAKALPLFKGMPFYAVNGDIIWLDAHGSNALDRLVQEWSDELDALLLLHPVEKAVGYDGKGDFNLGSQGTLIRRRGEKASYVYAGVQLLHPRLFKDCPDGAFSLNVLYDRAMQVSPPRIRGIVHAGNWLHVGDMQGLAEAEKRLLQV